MEEGKGRRVKAKRVKRSGDNGKWEKLETRRGKERRGRRGGTKENGAREEEESEGRKRRREWK